MTVKDDGLLPAFCRKRMLILGCGNVLFGDDGFGPAVIAHLLTHCEIPEDVYVMDVGTGIRKLLFTLALSSEHPLRIVIIDAVDKGKTPGEIFELPIDDLPTEKIEDFSFHQVPSSNLAREMKDAGVNIRVLACQVGPLPLSVKPGLSDALKDAVPGMCEKIVKEFSTESNVF